MEKPKSLAIAYSIQRKNKKAKAMAEGGEVDAPKNEYPNIDEQNQMLKEDAPLEKMYNPKAMAEGGEVKEHYDSIADAILSKKRKAQAMAEGGEVDLDENTVEGPDAMDELNVAGKENYIDSFDYLEQPEASDEHGDILEDEDSRDRVAAIRKKMKKMG